MQRRQFLGLGAATAALAGIPIHGYTRDLPAGKVVLIILEGGMDGLTAVPPVGDPSLLQQRRSLVATNPLKLNPFFGLHPRLSEFAGMLALGEAAIVHATSIPYVRRSHFEGQNLVESGIRQPFAIKTGWLGRALDEARLSGRALAVDTPLVIRGAKAYDNFYPSSIQHSSAPDSRLMGLLSTSHEAAATDAFHKLKRIADSGDRGPRVRDPEGLAFSTGRAMRGPEGPSVAVIRIPEFDTHANQGVDDGLHPELLALLDRVLNSLKTGLGPEWKNAVAVTATEFGRTIQENGSRGTEHGYGSVGLLAGGLLGGGKVLANWPGLREKDLYDGRDLQSTLDYRSVFAACVEAAFGLDHDLIAERVFMEPKLARTHDRIFG